VNSGSFRFNASSTARYLIFDVAAHEGQTHYDNLQLTVTGGAGGGVICRKPVLSLSDLNQANPQAPTTRLFWSVQPDTTVFPEWSTNLMNWLAVTNGAGGPQQITTPHGSVQWLNVTSPPTAGKSSFFRLRKG